MGSVVTGLEPAPSTRGGDPPTFVFISHSGFEEPVGAMIDALLRALRGSGYEPLLDRERVAHGTDFFAVVDRMIAVCHAAVVIVSRRALQRDRTWVLTEAARLRDRFVSDPRFQIMPVFVEGIGPTALGEEWEPAGLARFDGVRVKDPAAAADDVIKHLEPTRRRVQAAAAERVLADVLGRLPKDPTLRSAADLVTGDRRLAGELTLELAARLLSADAKTLWKVANMLRMADLQAAREVLGFALPFTWVDRTCAARIPRAVAYRRSVGLNSFEVETSKAYLHCASREWPTWDVVAVDPASDGESFDRAVSDALETLAHDDGELEPHFGDDEDAARGSIVLLAVRCPGFDPDFVAHMQRFVSERSGVGLILLGGDIDSTSIPVAVRAEIEFLQPELDRGREATHLKLMRELPNALVKRHKKYLTGIGAA